MNILFGQQVYQKIQQLQDQQVPRSIQRPDCFQSQPLCDFQSQMHNEGYLAAEIVKSIHGYTLRYATGLMNFAIIYSSRSFDASVILQFAQKWVDENPTKRYVFQR